VTEPRSNNSLLQVSVQNGRLDSLSSDEGREGLLMRIGYRCKG
jgi:hypothetical protein